uniref:Uncharacterized protein n=1 Tax=Glossina pallidipes TaxID=7398 RepID=A0A1A9ZM96_GLOPL
MSESELALVALQWLKCSLSSDNRSKLRATEAANLVTELTVPAVTFLSKDAEPCVTPTIKPQGPRNSPLAGNSSSASFESKQLPFTVTIDCNMTIRHMAAHNVCSGIGKSLAVVSESQKSQYDRKPLERGERSHGSLIKSNDAFSDTGCMNILRIVRKSLAVWASFKVKTRGFSKSISISRICNFVLCNLQEKKDGGIPAVLNSPGKVSNIASKDKVLGTLRTEVVIVPNSRIGPDKERSTSLSNVAHFNGNVKSDCMPESVLMGASEFSSRDRNCEDALMLLTIFIVKVESIVADSSFFGVGGGTVLCTGLLLQDLDLPVLPFKTNSIVLMLIRIGSDNF